MLMNISSLPLLVDGCMLPPFKELARAVVYVCLQITNKSPSSASENLRSGQQWHVDFG